MGGLVAQADGPSDSSGWIGRLGGSSGHDGRTGWKGGQECQLRQASRSAGSQRGAIEAGLAGSLIPIGVLDMKDVNAIGPKNVT